MNRREFLEASGAGVLAAVVSAVDCGPRAQRPAQRGVSIVVDAADPVAGAATPPGCTPV